MKNKGFFCDRLISNAGIVMMFMSVFFHDQLYSQNQSPFYNQVAEIRIVFNENNWDNILDSLFENFGEDQRLKADVFINGKYFPGSGIRYKGYSSWADNQKKNPFNIDLDYTVKNANYMGFCKLKLSNVIHDPSFVREALTYEIARQYMPASQAGFAAVYVNDVYIGLYTNVEAVDNLFAEKHFGSKDHAFFKGNPETLEYPFGENSNLAYTHGNDSSSYFPYYKIQNEFGWTKLLNAIYALDSDSSHIPSYFNIDRVLWMHALNYTLVNLDSYIAYSQNYYLYEDALGRFNTIPWDFNMSFGSFRLTDGTTLNLSIAKAEVIDPLQHYTGNSFSPRPLIKKIMRNETYRKKYLAHIRTILKENIDNGLYLQRASDLQNEIDSFVQADSNKFYSYTDFLTNLHSQTGSGSALYPGIENFMIARSAYLYAYKGISGPPVISQISTSPVFPQRDSIITITAKCSGCSKAFAYIRYCDNDVFHEFEMFDDGLHNDGASGDSVYAIEIAASGPKVDYYFWTENDSAGIFSPERAEYGYYTLPVRLKYHEIVINETGIQQSGYWIELFNPGSETVSLRQLMLSQKDSSLLLPDTLIKPGDFCLIDETSNLLTGLNDSDKLYLKYDNTNIIDSLVTGLPTNDMSTGRFPNGNGDFTLLSPTPSAYNHPTDISFGDIGIYPNPADEWIKMVINKNSETVIAELISPQGTTLLVKEIKSLSSPEIITLPLAGIAPGCYYLRIGIDGSFSTRALIIQK